MENILNKRNWTIFGILGICIAVNLSGRNSCGSGKGNKKIGKLKTDCRGWILKGL